ncbi:hypothetical protein BD626DRAFT_34161 [Schizophyllum amplum]|uniref:Uncharacterized protein n=1 Tax=Schizophyllum amplum TaxID=97359 RepID=A0A550CEE5_9AGAR|nr:hypothetical protein BD626DRAFT_34161 [Auriculariopsis ampla]
MAALYLHNAIFSPTSDGPNLSPSGSGSEISHDRARTNSTATLTPSASENSHPTEPLLRAETNEALAYLELLSRQPKHPNAPPPPWDTALSLEGDPLGASERNAYREHAARRRLRRLRWMKSGLEVIFVAWSVYTAVRYFLALAQYRGTVPRALSAAMGTCMSVCAACMLLNLGLCAMHAGLILRAVALDNVARWENVIAYVGSFLLVVPTVVNLALVPTWRNSPDVEVSIAFRCHLDVDVLWAVGGSCESPSWVAYIGLAVGRVLVTIGIVALYQRVVAMQHLGSSLRTRNHQPIMTEMAQTPVSTPFTDLPSPRRRSRLQKTSSKNAVDRNSNQRHSVASASTRSPSPSDEDSEEVITPRASHTEHDQELRSFAERFRTLMAEINEETEDAIVYARPDSALGYASNITPDGRSSSDSEFLHGRNGEFDPYVFDASYQPHPLSSGTPFIGRDEFGRPYPPDGVVRVLNGYVRRMPTIESLGSREFAWSRPATRTTMFSMQTGGSEGGRSRANSLNALAMSPSSETGGLEADDGRQSRGAESSASRADSMGRASGRTGGTHPTTSSRSTNSFYSAGSSPVASPASTPVPLPVAS